MFTGIIEGIGRVIAVRRTNTGVRLTVDVGPLSEGLVIGHSVAISGACLTVVNAAGTNLDFDVVRETLEKTSLGELTSGSFVNVERPMQVGDRFHGHFVQGHVDGTGRIISLPHCPEGGELLIKTSPELTGQMIIKGSVALDGVSLTIARLEPGQFSIALIPHTLKATTFHMKRPGDTVNIELDMLGKYVARLLGRGTRGTGLTEDKLREAGWC